MTTFATGREAYENDLRELPVYPESFGIYAGQRRPTWDELPGYAQANWNKYPTSRSPRCAA